MLDNLRLHPCWISAWATDRNVGAGTEGSDAFHPLDDQLTITRLNERKKLCARHPAPVCLGEDQEVAVEYRRVLQLAQIAHGCGCQVKSDRFNLQDGLVFWGGADSRA